MQPYGFVALYVICAALCIHKGFVWELLDKEHFALKHEVSWSFLFFLNSVCIYRLLIVYVCFHETVAGKCALVHNTLTLFCLGAHLAIAHNGIAGPYFLSTSLFSEWSLLPFFFWICVWTKFNKQGW